VKDCAIAVTARLAKTAMDVRAVLANENMIKYKAPKLRAARGYCYGSDLNIVF